MRLIADLHIHSRFSRATSSQLTPENLYIWAQKKGLNLIGTGDFTHPGWLKELKEKLSEAEEGLYTLKRELRDRVSKDIPDSCRSELRFILSGELSCIYKKGGRLRKLHHLILMPDFRSVERLNRRLSKIGNIAADGRPILGIDSKDLLEIVLEIDQRSLFIPAHIWTPWFSLFGSRSGFDEIEECFGELSSEISALETGLSSDPIMNRYLSCLDDYILVSNSDAHSLAKLGREANLMDSELNYPSIFKCIKTGEGFLGTIEFFPEEGKYHLDGHRRCGICLHPEETRRYGGICPVCNRPVTVGVLHRVFELADRKSPQLQRPFYSLIPLDEILAELMGSSPSTKKVREQYEMLLKEMGPELHILMDIPLDEIKDDPPLLKEAIRRMREGKVIREAGYDGRYGRIRLFKEGELLELSSQMRLFSIPEENKEEGETEDKRGHRKEKKEEVMSSTLREKDHGILKELNEEQREAVLLRGANLLIVAGPGTGKTFTLAHRISSFLISQEASPSQILALTFTRKAAEEMRQRITEIVKIRDIRGLYVNTFHGFCADILKENSKILSLPDPFIICNERLSEEILKDIVRERCKEAKKRQRLLKEFIPSRIRLSKGKVDIGKDVKDLIDLYTERLRENSMLDFVDLEIETVRLLKKREISKRYAERFPYIFVDEYQDTNPLQVLILKGLFKRSRSHITAIGDPDQAIYGFRGADRENFFRFSKDFPPASSISLSVNYRSTSNILRCGARLMRHKTPLRAYDRREVPIKVVRCKDHWKEAEFIAKEIEDAIGGTSFLWMDTSHKRGELQDTISFSDIAILFRTNQQADIFEDAFKRFGIPYIRSGKQPLIQRHPIDRIWKGMMLLAYPEIPLLRDRFLKDIGKRQYEKIRAIPSEQPLSEILDEIAKILEIEFHSDEELHLFERFKGMAEDFSGNLTSFLNLISLERGMDQHQLIGDRVSIMTIHAAKGLEWQSVFICGFEDGLIPLSIYQNADMDEEKRIFYVGMTRARLFLTLIYTERRMINGRWVSLPPSPYLTAFKELSVHTEESHPPKRMKRDQSQLSLF
ncbi:MAG TPA: hypothetical protein ENF54_03750 [Desulfobacteraceae bacterium]|nr:hypothetical protein [Desulfobacteraceae bacterium]